MEFGADEPGHSACTRTPVPRSDMASPSLNDTTNDFAAP